MLSIIARSFGAARFVTSGKPSDLRLACVHRKMHRLNLDMPDEVYQLRLDGRGN